ncbi:DEAD/DEAH box helicase family protein [Methanobacterium paludis]|uniref:DEAD/DEAH box helicase family protein n=1 Tax=Methanobacterium paludis (strain DSM 25820 / JCM 18151 / SWAN1) TaxID=868131 RepID=UPI001D11C3D7|nr:DEAD/DEAH box helicase family protein [Methanobacterium paludis]
MKNEQKTRKDLIDPALEKVGWLSKYIKEEVNSVKSDFKNKDFILFKGEPEHGVDRFIDYLLLDEDNSVLAIIEAKRFSKNPEKGRIQARTYSKDIEGQIGIKVPFFLTNGAKWFFIDEEGIERKVSGPFSQEDLKRRREIHKKSRDPAVVKVNHRIVDRPRSIKIVRELSEHFSKGHRTALVHMATGTGKTRVAMAIIDLLRNANVVRNVLFIADRIALVEQTKTSGFEQFFTEPIADLREGFKNTARLYVSTVQTLMGGKHEKMYEKFSPAFFDLIVFDEAHRSIYDKNNHIQQYFDAIMIGLTATPRERESQSTFELFGCREGKPTVEYSYEDAIRDGVLVPYRAEALQTKVLELGIYGGELNKRLKTQLRRQEEDPDTFEVTGSDFDRIFMDDKTNELIIREFMDRCYKSNEGKPAKTIFFCASQRHARQVKKVFGELFPKLSADVQAITSDMYRAEDEVKRFKISSEPRIAISVGMLDTGVDIPEVCNLVFVKPVFSNVRFWQMLGRGTRNFKSCKHPEWLPNGDKKDFLIFDFTIGGYSNLRIHLESEGVPEKEPQKSVMVKIFENRANLLDKSLTESQKNIISNKIMGSINSLDEGSFIVREKLPIIEQVKSNSSYLENYVNELKDEISSLMILEPGSNSTVSSFILKTENLFGFILARNHEEIGKLRSYVSYMLRNILTKDNLNDIKMKRDEILRAMQNQFWEDLAFEDVEFLVRELAPLMKYFEPERKEIIQSDAPDFIMSREQFVKEVEEDPKIKEFLEGNNIIWKIKEGQGITSPELLELERELNIRKPGLTIDNVQKHQNKDFIIFLREIIGLSRTEDPKALIEKRFSQFIIEKSQYSSRQIDFLLLLRRMFADRKHIELGDLAEPPLSDEHPLDIFEIGELERIVDCCNRIKMC